MILSDSAKSIFNSLHEGIVIIDTRAVIVFANNAYKSFVSSTSGVSVDEIEGRYLKELRPGARLPEVLVTGRPYIQEERKESADIYFVNMHPIKEGKDITGAISVFRKMRSGRVKSHFHTPCAFRFSGQNRSGVFYSFFFPGRCP